MIYNLNFCLIFSILFTVNSIAKIEDILLPLWSTESVNSTKIISNFLLDSITNRTICVSLLISSSNVHHYRFQEELITNIIKSTNFSFIYQFLSDEKKLKIINRSAFNLFLVEDFASFQ